MKINIILIYYAHGHNSFDDKSHYTPLTLTLNW